MKRIFIILLLLLSCILAKSQVQVFGTVTDNHNGDILIGASVEISGDPSSRVYTSESGFYKIFIPDIDGSTVLVFSYLGYRTEQIQMYHRDVNVSLSKSFEVEKKTKNRWVIPSFIVKGHVFGVGRDNLVGDPIMGAVVSVNGTDIEVVTDADGYYEITIPENIKNPELCYEYIVVQEIIPINGSIEVLDAYLYYSFPTDFRSKEKKKTREITEGEYITLYKPKVFALSLTGSLPQTNFGVGASFNNVYMGQRTHFTLDGKYYTDFDNNSITSGNIQLNQLVKGFDLKFEMNKFDIPQKGMDMCVYRGDIYWQPSMGLGFALYYGMEYIDHKSKFMRGITSLIFGTEFRVMPRGYFSADIGFTDSGPAHFMFGYKYHASPNMPFDINIDGGSWMRKLRVDANISKRVKNVIFSLGYEKLYKYDNAYLTLTVPLF